MSESLVHLQPAFILQHRPYRETSLLLEVFTRDFGIVSMLAKGVRREKSKMAGLLLPFTALKLSFINKDELKILTQTEYVGSYGLERLALYCGFYVNELLQIFVHKYDPHPELFAGYEQCLSDLADSSAIEQTLRYFELDLLEHVGYAVSLDVDGHGNPIRLQERYHFMVDFGFLPAHDGLVSGNALRAMADRSVLEGHASSEAKYLMRKMLDEHLHGRSLKSRDVLASLIKHL